LVGGLYPSISGGVAGAVLLVLAVGVSKVVHRMKKVGPDGGQGGGGNKYKVTPAGAGGLV